MKGDLAPDGADILRQPKLAHRVAAQLEKHIIRSGWKVGEILGSEADLAKRHGVSRWVMREAMSIAERDGLVEIRRGRNGGVAVAAPALEAVGSAIRSYLGVCRVSTAELNETRLTLESLMMRLASARLDDARIARLREIAAQAGRPGEDGLDATFLLLRELLLSTGNVALQVFAFALSQVTVDLALQQGVSAETLSGVAHQLVRFRQSQIEAVIADDVPRATRLVRQHLEVAARLVAKAPHGAPDARLVELSRRLIGSPAGRAKAGAPKLTEQITSRLQAEIVAANWPVGKHIGSEPELMARYGVSRSVLREAIRPLERLGIVVMRHGRDSGLKVAPPEPSAIIKSAVLYLNYYKLDQASAYEVQEVLEIEAVEAIAQLPQERRAPLAAQLMRIARRTKRPDLDGLDATIREFYYGIASATPKPIVALFLRILAETMMLGRTRGPGGGFGRLIEEIRARQVALVDTLVAGDTSLARRRIAELRRAVTGFGARQKRSEDLIPDDDR